MGLYIDDVSDWLIYKDPHFFSKKIMPLLKQLYI